MNGNLEPRQFDTRFLVTVITIIVLSLAALAWSWRSAHSSHGTSHASQPPWPYDNRAHDAQVPMPPTNPTAATRRQ